MRKLLWFCFIFFSPNFSSNIYISLKCKKIGKKENHAKYAYMEHTRPSIFFKNISYFHMFVSIQLKLRNQKKYCGSIQIDHPIDRSIDPNKLFQEICNLWCSFFFNFDLQVFFEKNFFPFNLSFIFR